MAYWISPENIIECGNNLVYRYIRWSETYDRCKEQAASTLTHMYDMIGLPLLIIGTSLLCVLLKK